MQRTMSGMILGLLLFCCGGVLVASEADELRDRAKVLRKEASVMTERGNKELGRRLESESVWMLEAAERLGDRPDISEAGELRDRAKVLRKEASVMAERGDKELGGRLERESVWMREAAERLEFTAREVVRRETAPASTRKCVTAMLSGAILDLNSVPTPRSSKSPVVVSNISVSLPRTSSWRRSTTWPTRSWNGQRRWSGTCKKPGSVWRRKCTKPMSITGNTGRMSCVN